MCPKFVPTEAEKEVVAQALNTIGYERGTSQCVMFDDNGAICVKNMPNFGNYFGPQKFVDIELEDGKMVSLPVRNANVTVALDAEVNCSDGTGRIASVYVVNKVDCGCRPAPMDKTIDPIDESANGDEVDFEFELVL